MSGIKNINNKNTDPKFQSILNSINKKYGIITIIASIVAVSVITMGSTFEKRKVVERDNTVAKSSMTSNSNNNTSSSNDGASNNNQSNSGHSSSSDSSGYKDGEYTGQAKGFNGDVKVIVKISGGKISSIDILENSDDKEYFDMARAVIDEVIKNQNTNVEAVSGATYSSNGILDAIQKALDSGV